LTIAIGVCLLPGAVNAQSNAAQSARRQWVTISYDWIYNWPLDFASHPVEDLVGADVVGIEDGFYDYQTADGATRIAVLEFKRRVRGAGITVYPFGLSVGPALGIRVSFEEVPDIRIAFDGPGTLDSYVLSDATSFDIGAGLYASDRAPGWGLGSYAYIAGGFGRIRSDIRDGSRYYAEGGGGVQSGPFGVELAVKVGWNRFEEPVEHRVFTFPITLRGTVSF
jgi:hypothetical protein